METIPRTQLAELMKRATTYDDWAIPLDSRLRQGLAVAGLGMVITMIIDFMQLGGNLLYSMSMGRFVVNLCGLVLLAILGFKTEWFQVGQIAWHRLGMGLVAVGGLDILLITSPIWMALLQILFWVALLGIVGVVVLIVTFIGALFR